MPDKLPSADGPNLPSLMGGSLSTSKPSPEHVSESTIHSIADDLGHKGWMPPLAIPNHTLHSEIAKGGMGVVYRARQAGTERWVALKVIRDVYASSLERKRFLAEIRAVGKLDHPHIVSVYEVGEVNGQPYFTMKLIEGQSLATVLNGKPLSVDKTIRWLCIIGEAIHYAHLRGIIHRDLKPGNILIDEHEVPYVTDFGLAKSDDQPAELTGTGQALGTPQYMPPEQALGKKEAVGVRSDVYSLGAILYTCLTGQPPFQAANPMATIVQLIQREATLPSQLNSGTPIDLQTICMKCLEKEPDARYATVAEFVDDLRRFENHVPILARPATYRERVGKWIRRNPSLASLMVVSLVAVFLIASISLIASYNQRLRRSLSLTEQAKLDASIERDRAEASLLLAKRSGYLRDITLANAAFRDGDMAEMDRVLDRIDPAARSLEYHLLDHWRHQHCRSIRFPKHQFVSRIHLLPREQLALAVSSEKTCHYYFDRQGLQLLQASPEEWAQSPSIVRDDFLFSHSATLATFWHRGVQNRINVPLVPTDTAIEWDSEKSQLVVLSTDTAVSSLTVYSFDPYADPRFEVPPILFQARLAGPIQCMQIDPVHRRLHLVGKIDEDSLVWQQFSLDDWYSSHQVTLPHAEVRMVRLFPELDRLAIVTKDNRIYLPDASKLEVGPMVYQASENLTGIALFPDRRRIGISTVRGTISVVALDDEQAELQWSAHAGGVSDIAVGGDGETVYSTGFQDHMFKEWKLSQLKIRGLNRDRTHKTRCCVYGSEGIFFAWIETEEQEEQRKDHLYLENRETGALVQRPVRQGAVQMVFRERDRRLLVAYQSGEVHEYSTEGLLEASSIEGMLAPLRELGLPFPLRKWEMAISDDRRWLACISPENILQIIDISQWEISQRVPVLMKNCFDLRFLPNSDIVCFAAPRLGEEPFGYHAESGKPAIFPMELSRLRHFQFSQDGQHLFGQNGAGELVRLDTERGELRWKIPSVSADWLDSVCVGEQERIIIIGPSLSILEAVTGERVFHHPTLASNQLVVAPAQDEIAIGPDSPPLRFRMKPIEDGDVPVVLTYPELCTEIPAVDQPRLWTSQWVEGRSRALKGSAAKDSDFLSDKYGLIRQYPWSLDLTLASLQDAKGKIRHGVASTIVTCSEKTDPNWNLQAVKGGLRLEDERDYEVAWEGRSVDRRISRVAMQCEGGEWPNIGLWEEVEWQPDWKACRIRFRAKGVTGLCRFSFILGDEVGSIEIRDLSLRLVETP